MSTSSLLVAREQRQRLPWPDTLGEGETNSMQFLMLCLLFAIFVALIDISIKVDKNNPQKQWEREMNRAEGRRLKAAIKS